MNFNYLFLTLIFLSGCSTDSQKPDSRSFDFSFESTTHDFVGDFADYSPGEEEFFELGTGHLPLPEPLESNFNGLFITGNNHSDDLFMYYRGLVEGLEPGTSYEVSFHLEFATNVPQNCFGIGGAPGEGVIVKVGVSVEEPIPIIKQEEPDIYRLNIDKGNQSNEGSNTIVLGNVANSRDCQEEQVYELKQLHEENKNITIKTGQEGQAWVFFGTDSGFEGKTTLYYTRFIATFITPN